MFGYVQYDGDSVGESVSSALEGLNGRDLGGLEFYVSIFQNKSERQQDR